MKSIPYKLAMWLTVVNCVTTHAVITSDVIGPKGGVWGRNHEKNAIHWAGHIANISAL